MILAPVKTSDAQGTQQQGLVSGTGQFRLASGLLGGVNISTNGTNAAAVTVRRETASGEVVVEFSTTSPMFVIAPLQADKTCHFSVSGTGASAQFFEWVD
jgi:hypothetical protein